MKIQTQSCVVNGKRDVAVIAQEVDYRGQGTLVKISRGGICGSDLHYFQEGRVGNFQVRQPMVLGHEVIGEVVASDSPQLPVGQKVALNPSKPCGQCKYCLAQQSNQCVEMRFFGSAMYFPHVDGAFTQYKVVDSAQCIPYGADRDDRVMVFAEPLAVAIHAAKQPRDVTGKDLRVRRRPDRLPAGGGAESAGRRRDCLCRSQPALPGDRQANGGRSVPACRGRRC